MKKKVVSVMLLVALVGSSLSATTITAYAEDHDPVNLTFWGWTASDFEAKSIQDGLDAFQEKYPWITVEYMTVPSADYHKWTGCILPGCNTVHRLCKSKSSYGHYRYCW